MPATVNSAVESIEVENVMLKSDINSSIPTASDISSLHADDLATDKHETGSNVVVDYRIINRPVQTSGFLKLPTEIRLEIYKYQGILTSTKYEIMWTSKRRMLPKHITYQRSLNQTSSSHPTSPRADILLGRGQSTRAVIPWYNLEHVEKRRDDCRFNRDHKDRWNIPSITALQQTCFELAETVGGLFYSNAEFAFPTGKVTSHFLQQLSPIAKGNIKHVYLQHEVNRGSSQPDLKGHEDKRWEKTCRDLAEGLECKFSLLSYTFHQIIIGSSNQIYSLPADRSKLLTYMKIALEELSLLLKIHEQPLITARQVPSWLVALKPLRGVKSLKKANITLIAGGSSSEHCQFLAELAGLVKALILNDSGIGAKWQVVFGGGRHTLVDEG